MNLGEDNTSNINWQNLLEQGLKTASQVYIARQQAKTAATAAPLALPGDFYSGSQSPFTYQNTARYSPQYVPPMPRQDNTLLYLGLGAAALVGVFLLMNR